LALKHLLYCTQRGKRWIFETKTYPNVHQGEL
jgi:hypothetical protein